VSRPAADVLREAERLVAAGVKELLVISQDTSAYGIDLKYAPSDWKGGEVRAKFLDLARALGEVGVWVRLHYVYPYPHVDQVIPLMADGHILPYLDVPFQHASPALLKRMRRPAAQEETLSRIRQWRTVCPGLTIRSTFIVGFPGETEEDFALLLDWLGEAELDRIGCFRYEPVAGAAANDLGAPVPDEVKEERWHRFMQAQQSISAKRLKRRIGAREQIIIDEVGVNGAGPRSAKGRSKGDAPQIDGTVLVESRRPLRVGEIATVKIEHAGPTTCAARQSVTNSSVRRKSIYSCFCWYYPTFGAFMIGEAPNRDRNFHHSHRTGRGKDHHRRLTHPAFARDRTRCRCDQADRLRLRTGACGNERSGDADRCVGITVLAGNNRAHVALAISRRAAARPGGAIRETPH
jgi:hypothetical protein